MPAPRRPAPGRPSPKPRPPAAAAVQPLTDAEIERLGALLAAVPAPLDAPDLSLLDGFLCGVLVQPRAVPPAAWRPQVLDVDGRRPPAGFDAAPLLALAARRHRELDAAIADRRWFDPWIFAATADDASFDALVPWVTGFALALERFPELLATDDPALTEPLALVFRHLDADELDDAAEVLEEIESLEPPADLPTAVEELVRATLLLADVGRPLPPR